MGLNHIHHRHLTVPRAWVSQQARAVGSVGVNEAGRGFCCGLRLYPLTVVEQAGIVYRWRYLELHT